VRASGGWGSIIRLFCILVGLLIHPSLTGYMR